MNRYIVIIVLCICYSMPSQTQYYPDYTWLYPCDMYDDETDNTTPAQTDIRVIHPFIEGDRLYFSWAVHPSNFDIKNIKYNNVIYTKDTNGNYKASGNVPEGYPREWTATMPPDSRIGVAFFEAQY